MIILIYSLSIIPESSSLCSIIYPISYLTYYYVLSLTSNLLILSSPSIQSLCTASQPQLHYHIYNHSTLCYSMSLLLNHDLIFIGSLLRNILDLHVYYCYYSQLCYLITISTLSISLFLLFVFHALFKLSGDWQQI